MILRNILLKDFGLYAGHNELDLMPKRRYGQLSPIVLIGGKNGAGKTTLLEAVRLALYGRRALGTRVGQSEYESYLRGCIHQGGGATSSTVGLEFDYAEAGEIHRYEVQREWSIRGKSLVETLLLEKDGSSITSVPQEEWSHFLQELIPPGVSQLFFFDGEKIKDIADSENDNEQLASAVRGLLGIELVGRLREDIGLFLARNQAGDSGKTIAKLENLNHQLHDLDNRTAALAEDIAELTSARESQARAAERIRRNFVAEGGDAALKRAKIEVEREKVKEKIRQCEQQLRDVANKLLPFSLAPRLLKSFSNELKKSTASHDRNAAAHALKTSVEAWRVNGMPKRNAAWNSKHWVDLEAFLDEWSGQSTESKRLSPALLEIGDGAAALARLSELETVTRPQALDLSVQLGTLDTQLRDAEIALARADNAASSVLLDELRLAEQKVGATEAILRAKNEELKIARGQMVTLDRDRNRVLEEQANVAKSNERTSLAARTAQALAEYEGKLLEQKISQLREEFVRCFNHLSRKGDLLADIQIDVSNFNTTLIDQTGRALPKSQLSAGEKQIYAIAILWALARTSGRPLPMIIDTPLARLDSEHRSNLVERYFPAASHQVILLSTDTEIDEEQVAALDRNISHSYRLEYVPEEKRTVILNGYFERPTQAQEERRAI